MSPRVLVTGGTGKVGRRVLVGASSIEMDSPLTGKAYRWLAEHALEWVVLRPSWFMQNFSEGQHRERPVTAALRRR